MSRTDHQHDLQHVTTSAVAVQCKKQFAVVIGFSSSPVLTLGKQLQQKASVDHVTAHGCCKAVDAYL